MSDEKQVTQLNVWNTMLKNIISLCAFLYIGTLTDILGRKTIMFTFLTGSLVTYALAVLNSVFLLWPKELTLLTSVPVSLVGALDCWLMVLFTFVSGKFQFHVKLGAGEFILDTTSTQLSFENRKIVNENLELAN